MDPRDAKAAASREPVAEPAALPWGMDKAGVQKSSLTALTDEKLARFVIGNQKKTKYEKEREERELKKRKADVEAAAMYAKFVASFEDEDETLGKAFVRSGAAASDHDSVYRLQATGTKKKTASDMERLVDEMKQKQDTLPPKKKRREMDLLVEEIKSRESSAPVLDDVVGPMKAVGSFDNGDPETTNLYVGNLAPSVTEEKLEHVFRKHGRIYSIKIMWPRSEEERSRRRMSGFVSFFTRREADDARVHLHDSELDGQRIVVGWGKAVKIDPSAAAFSAVPTTVVPGLLPAPRPASSMYAVPSQHAKIVVRVPTDDSVRQRIDRLAAYVAKDGLEFENVVRLHESGNPEYAFLSLSDGASPSPDAVYYRWRVFAFAMGDTKSAWRAMPFQMTMNGPVWIPPPAPMPRPESARDARDGRPNRTRDTRSRSRSPSHSHSHSRGRDRNSRRSPSSSRSRSRSRRSHSRSRSNRRSRSGSRSRRRRSRSRSDSSSDSGSDRSRRRRRSRSYSRSRSRSSRRYDNDTRSSSRRDHRDRDGRPSRSRSRSPLVSRHHVTDDAGRKKVDETMLTGQQLARARDLERGREPNRLPRDAYDQFMELLDALTLERESIKQAMGCALDNSECAVELVHLLRKRFHRDDVSAVLLVAYLYVASDLLHNSSAAVKNASLFRTTFQECLPEIVDRLRRVQRSLQGRMSALAMRDKVLAVLTAWGSWSLFPPHYLVGLNATFLRKVEEHEYLLAKEEEAQDGRRQSSGMDEEKLRRACSQAGILSSGSAREMVARLQWLKEFTAPTSSTSTATATAPKATVPAVTPANAGAIKQRLKDEAIAVVENKKETDEDNVDDVDGEPMDRPTVAQDDLDGEPLDGADNDEDREDLDGAPLDDEGDVDGAPLDDDDDDVDGEPLDDDDDVDGEPLDDADVDGEPL